METGSIFYCYNGLLSNEQRHHIKISNSSEMVTKILRPCLSKLLDFVNLMIFPRISEWGVLHIVTRRIPENVIYNQIFRHTLF